jgi:hypothetical protein
MIKWVMIAAMLPVSDVAQAGELTKNERQYVVIAVGTVVASQKCGFSQSASVRGYFDGFGISKTRRDQIGAAVLEGLSNRVGIHTDPKKEMKEVSQITNLAFNELDADLLADRREACDRWRTLLYKIGLIQ